MCHSTTATVSLNEIFSAMRQCFRQAVLRGRNYHAVTVGVDGEPYVREDISRSVSQEEYFRQGRPHTVTVWSTRGEGGSHLSAEEAEEACDLFDPAEQFGGSGGIPELVRTLESAGFAVEV